MDMFFGYYSRLKPNLVKSIMDDPEMWRKCQLLAREDLSADHVASDLAELMVIRVKYLRKDKLTWAEQMWEGIWNVDRKTIINELNTIREKYGLSYHLATVLTDEIVKEYNGTVPTPIEQLWDILRPLLGMFLEDFLEAAPQKRITYNS